MFDLSQCGRLKSISPKPEYSKTCEIKDYTTLLFQRGLEDYPVNPNVTIISEL